MSACRPHPADPRKKRHITPLAPGDHPLVAGGLLRFPDRTPTPDTIKAMTTQDHAGIGTPETLPITKLNTFHKNARRGDVDAIAGSLAANGQFRPIVVNKGTHTGRPYEVLAGNHTLKAVRQLAETHPDDPRWHHIDTWVVDVDDERAARIVLADNRTADLGSYDDESLLDLLETVDHDLDGTGYDYDDLDMLRDLNDGAPSLDELEDEYGEPEDDDFWITIRFKVPPILSDQWNDWARAYDTPEEAFEALLDKGTNYGADT